MCVTTVFAVCLSAPHWEELYFRVRYGPRVPASEYSSDNVALSLSIVIRGERFYLDRVRKLDEQVPPQTDTTHGVWETGSVRHPYVVKLGEETLFACRTASDALQAAKPQ